MITNIGLDCINSYKKLSALKTDKKINLIYGLNGTGKSTFTDYLYDKGDERFSSCTIEGLSDDEKLLVYNQSFIRDTFYEPDNLKGIFTLSKENKEARQKISAAQAELNKLDDKKLSETEKQRTKLSEIKQKRNITEGTTWEIKRNFTGGDRILEFCLEGLKKSKEKLLNYLMNLQKPTQKPTKSTDDLKKEAEAIQGETAQKHSPVSKINFSRHDIESNEHFKKVIVGNTSSTVADLIQELSNSDWVKSGLEYLPEAIDDDGSPCPFCQNKTITRKFVSNLKDFFDESYEKDIEMLKALLSDYQEAVDNMAPKDGYLNHPFIIEKKGDFNALYNEVSKVLSDNIREIKRKIKSPSIIANIKDSSDKISDLNQYLDGINSKIIEHNNKIDHKDIEVNRIKDCFWEIMRWDYDQAISIFVKETKALQGEQNLIYKEIQSIEKKIKEQKKIIEAQQKNTVNIESAITKINNDLLNLGIDDFHIDKHSDDLYKIVRDGKTEAPFQSLSEGEKMIISFLYFCELCKGKQSATEVDNKKIIVIDDPISSLSHIYIFNVGQMIKNHFFNSIDYEQVFVLTHSLYFFYELTERNHKQRNEKQKLFRMIKNSDGSHILDMRYSEIQNDYHSYWHVIKDENQPPALIANCMRNIIEYFFNFVEKKDLYNVFRKPELQQNKYQAFIRYIDRESHSDWQNIFDFKEFNYNDFKDALGLVFKESGYIEHYQEMIR